MFGGAGGRGSRASVSSLEGLRNVLRNDPERDPAPAGPAAPPAAPAVPADDKQTLRGLNDRLSGYLGRVKQLEKENREMKEEIDEILRKRKTPEGRDWDEVEKPLSDLKNKVPVSFLYLSPRRKSDGDIGPLIASMHPHVFISGNKSIMNSLLR